MSANATVAGYCQKQGFSSVKKVFLFASQSHTKTPQVKVKVLLRVKVKDATGAEHLRCEVKQSADTAIIRIEGFIDWWVNNSAKFRAAIDALKNAGIKKLELYVNSGGGSVSEAFEIANILRTWTDDKTLTLGALCASAATYLILPFDKKHVKSYRNITAMMHNPQALIEGEEKDLLSGAKLLANTKKIIIKEFAARMGLTDTQLSNKMDATWWMTYQDLVDYNLVGSSVEGNDELPKDTAKVFNQMKYENVPVVLNKALGIELLNIEEEDTDPSGESGKGTNPLKTTMKNLIQLLMVSMTALKAHLTDENANEAQLVAALNKVFTEKENKITELTESLKTEQDKVKNLNTQVENHNAAMIKARLDIAQNNEKKITADQRKVYEDQVKNKKLDFEGLDAILNAIPARVTLKQQLENNAGGGKGAGKEKDEEREQPEFVETNEGRLYNKAGNQRDILNRMIAEQSKK
jgi:ATP-dependent protease ClpP protease subunit